MRTRAAALLLAASLAGCATPEPAPRPPLPGPDRMVLQPIAFDRLAGWSADDIARVLPALQKSCNRITKLPVDKSIGFEGVGGTAADWYSPCAAAARVAAGDHDGARAMFETWFTPWQVTNDGRADGLFTGYFEPEIRGSRHRKGAYVHPIHGKPNDLVVTKSGPEEQAIGRMENGRLVPYHTRAEIERGALAGKAPVLAWTDDPVDLAIMHIQGSGRVRLDDGTVIRLGVAGSNGHKFIGIGKVLKDEGKLGADTSMPAIRAWLKANPEEGRALLARNPRYIFYGPNPATDGPMGTEGVALTPERSLAVDPRFVPLGAPVWLDSVDPAGRPLRRMMMAQDTGAAIKGPVRGDVFWGAGETAFQIAGKMKSPGRLVVFLPRARSPRLAQAAER
ncbi:putative Membrane-bound lytic murein transglycosylase [Magnetospirillum sp. XM-1]|uniref:murein transglycosylase A n=1 Tax=Magnetospirillum sp. XM-1 TaxID=1663591 RepID=UPI00073DC2A9|nr:MltA domain-containing protein [Magnetospirillum sp. XM-1]CUW37894.1 putative Membrane-bound lytic murein transglycosylase [Magnetospirillum sp. XM-1]